VEVEWWSSEKVEEQGADFVGRFDGVLVPGGFGVRGVSGMLDTVQYIRESGIPYFGICLGLQSAIIEFARNVCHLEDSHSREFAPECADPVVSLMDSQRQVTDMGGTMRLGAYPCQLAANSRVAAIYGLAEISERHRHRYEVNNAYRGVLVDHGMALSGLSPDGFLVEIIELVNHPWFIATQFHPELKSRPAHPHPLFASFIEAALRRRGEHRTDRIQAVGVGE
jgi:CTP synthase